MTQTQPGVSTAQGCGASGRTWDGDHLSPPAIRHTPGKGWPVGWVFLLAQEGGEFVSWKGRRISLAWCALLQKGGFSSKGKGNETEKCLPLSKRDGEPCVIVLSAGASRCVFASSAASCQHPEGAMLRRDVLHAAAGDGGQRGRAPGPAALGWKQPHPSPTPWTTGSAWGEGGQTPSTQIPGSSWGGPTGALGCP